jgi:serine/threonine protein kinase
MDERCKSAHAKLLAGTCPWCGHPIISGQAVGELKPQPTSPSQVVDFERYKLASLVQMVNDTGPLEFRVAARYTAGVVGELIKLHEANLCHGAISPATIFIDEAGSIQLGGGGWCRVEQIPTDRWLEGLLDASRIADFLAPEQALSSGGPDPRSDIYSLGCTLYFLLTGRTPFSGTVSEKLLKHQTSAPQPLQELRPDVPLKLAQVCEKMMAKKPAERFQTANEVVVALSAWEEQSDST